MALREYTCTSCLEEDPQDAKEAVVEAAKEETPK
jgi:hypothetical protein